MTDFWQLIFSALPRWEWLALAWLLRGSPVMLPIPGTGSVDHLEENVAAAEVVLTDALYAELSALAAR